MRPRALYALLMLIFLAMAALPPAAAMSSGPVQGVRQIDQWQWYLVAFVGNSVVDLVWDQWSPDLGYKIMRDGHLIAELGLEVTYYRDLNVPAGSHTYQLYRVQDGGDLPSYSDTITMGQVRGILHQDLTWTQGTYTLATEPAYPPGAGWGIKGIHIMDGVTLHIGPGVTVVGEAEWYSFEGPGVVQIDGATLNMDWLELQNPSSYLKNSTVTLRRMNVVVDSTLDSNIIQVTEELSIQDQAQVILTNNTFYGTEIRVQDQAHVTMDHNTLHYHHDSLDNIWLTSSSNGGSLTNNTFVGCAQEWGQQAGSITVDTTAPVEIRGNHFRCISGTDGGGGIGVHAVNPGVIEENVFEGPSPFGDHLEPSISYGARGISLESGAAMAIRNNVFYNFPGAIVIDQANPEIENNRMLANCVALYVVGDITGTIRNNCIGAEAGGLIHAYSPTGAPLNVEENWWGDPTGPLHQSHPEGKGAWIKGRYVDFDPWLTDPGDLECGTTDLRIAGLEVVQVVQAVNNSVPLLENKPTVVRVYPDVSFGRESNVGLALTASRDGTILGTITPWRPPSIVQPVHNINQARADERRGGIFLLPADWQSGTLTLVAEVNPDHSIEEIIYSNNQATQTVTFDPEPEPLRVAYVPINYRPAAGGGGLPDIAGIPQWHEFMETIYPLTQVDYKVLPAINWPLQMKGAQPPGREDRRAELLLNRLSIILTHYNSSHPSQDPYDQVFGVFPGGAISFCISDPRWASGLGLASYCYRGGSWMAHEIGHNLGLRHPNTADACGALDPNTDWPYPNATIQEYGWDSRTNQVVANTSTDMMAYCELSEWISPFHYNKLIGASGGWQEPTGQLSAGQTYLIASGLVYTDGTVLFEPFWQISTSQVLENPPAGSDYCLELRDASDTVLQSHCFDLDFYNDQTYEETDADAFLVTLPLDANVQRVVLQQDTVELGAVTASAYSPTVTLLSPNGGEVLSGTVTVSWTASDGDGDPLSYSLFYSPDAGASWLPTAMDITGTAPYTLDLSLLPGTANAQLRIEASDGFHQASDTSDGTFTVEDKPPWVGISQPEGGTMLPPLTLQGYAYDPDEGVLEGEALVWSSDRDGALGTGERLENVALSLGRHVLTLTAIDSQGHQRSASTTVLVGSYIYLPTMYR